MQLTGHHHAWMMAGRVALLMCWRASEATGVQTPGNAEACRAWRPRKKPRLLVPENVVAAAALTVLQSVVLHKLPQFCCCTPDSTHLARPGLLWRDAAPYQASLDTQRRI